MFFFSVLTLILSSILCKVEAFHIDYKESSSDLCWIGAQYDTDKSSQRKNVGDQASRHCHPYTLFYHSLFKDMRDKSLNIAELGILHGSSILMWRDYFTRANIYGFDFSTDLLNSFKNTYDMDRISLSYLNVLDRRSITNALHSTRVKYDLIIDDTTHQFEDQVRIIQNIHSFLKPGGMLIIEDIFKRYNEKDYVDRLMPFLSLFQDYYFVTLDHKNRCSTGWDNDKLFILIKAGAPPIFRNKKKITIITPATSPLNLLKIKDSIDFDYVNEWIIVYDGKQLPENPQIFANENNPKIKEYVYAAEGTNGNPQRNYALDNIQIDDTYLYFLDEDSLVHKDLYKFLNIIDDGRVYTFLPDDRMASIETGMFLVDFKLCKTVRWLPSETTAAFDYMNECYLQNRDKLINVINPILTLRHEQAARHR